MKKGIIMLTATFLLSICVLIGCSSENATTEPTDTVETTTEETTVGQTTEPTATPETTEESHTHNYTEEITTDATCEADGLKTFTCECGDTYTEAIPATEHIYENYVSNNDATYTSDGTETAKCNTCDLTDTRTAEGSKLEYTYTEMNATMYATQTVNVRNLPNTDGEKIGSLSTNQEVMVLGQCNETSWYKFDYNGQTAFISNKYVSTEKIEVAPPTDNGNNSAASASGYPNPYDYPEGVWVDMGDWFFIVNSYEWGMNGANFTDIEATLQARFPGEGISSGGGFPLNDGSGRYCWFSFRQGTYLVPFTNAYMAK